MDTPKSWFNLQGFKHDLETMLTDRRKEEFVRDAVSGMVTECPIELLASIGKLIADYREKELNEPTNN